MSLTHKIYRQAPTRYRFIRQSVALEGMDSALFQEAIASIGHLHELYDRCFEEKQLERWSNQRTNGEEMLEASNRYLTPKKDAPTSLSVPFGRNTDPKGILEDMLEDGEGFVHTEDNIVEYFQQKTDANNTRR